ncbi:4-hydroxy-tetrahydrodipicolinate synthase [Pinisolibacter aquiterrae]|uniref:4-hydroxy-tetrahydrodipicolinate synthase n=1 Tax=Pinisolibacter aquiterrae TaxID=2815579 RepID=UPI001C3E6A70|nr:4-hydroxy-tetrahydrodipicolinate synthase [Pinisolibacter aquiterrae]MBV5265765.1 4-hydroxy-tetrahydrodipicolinate synthase [Pinisolibacter aquiterrae]MCC8236670.1 4-hydroxy-tetrahydrodipicolinate synthase [Pinisolibacter aquiterrae]
MIDQTEKDRWAGVFTALVTPFRDGEIDLPAFDALVERQIVAGVAGLVPVGTTGEAATLSDAEAVALIERTVRIAAGRALVVAGAGSNDTGKTVAKVRAAEKAGADAVLVVTPYYNKPTQAGLIAHYDAVAAATGRPVMLYSVPGRCGVEIAPATCAELMARRANVFVIKEAGGSVERVTRLRAACGDDLIVHSGDDGLTLPFLALGAVGVTSVVANVAPEAMVALVAAWRRGDRAEALRLHESLADLIAAMFVESNPGPVKAALALAGEIAPDMRLPLVPVAASTRELLAGLLDPRTVTGRAA